MSLLAALGIPVPAWVIEIVAVVAIALGAYGYVLHKGKAEELAKLQVSSAALIHQVTAENAATSAQYAKTAAANQEKLNAANQANAALADALDQRVRDFDAYRRAHPDVARAPGVAGPASGGECGAIECSQLVVLMGELGDLVARRNGELAAALQSCQRDRDSLTGLPL